jgi:hypothetical protein
MSMPQIKDSFLSTYMLEAYVAHRTVTLDACCALYTVTSSFENAITAACLPTPVSEISPRVRAALRLLFSTNP